MLLAHEMGHCGSAVDRFWRLALSYVFVLDILTSAKRVNFPLVNIQKAIEHGDL
jgi:hypothetical protein